MSCPFQKQGHDWNEFLVKCLAKSIRSRNGNGESVINGKNVRTLAEQHYSSAASMFQQLENWSELLRIQLERAGLYEFQLRRKDARRCRVPTTGR